jgi:hypothetical protein
MVASVAELVAGTSDLGRPGDKMTSAALDRVVVDIAAAAPAVAADTLAAVDMIVVGIAVT